MKNQLLLTLMAATMLFSACKNITAIPNPGDPKTVAESSKTFKTQFDAIWDAINIGYVFWDIDTINWDARYDKMIALGERLDKTVPTQGLTLQDSLDIRQVFDGLIDHHMVIYAYNPYSTTKKVYIGIDPAGSEIKSRSYYRASIPFAEWRNGMKQVGTHMAITDSVYSVYVKPNDPKQKTNMFSCLINGNIAYLHMDGYSMTAALASQQGQAILQWLDNIGNLLRQGQLKGVILDNRENGGGALIDMCEILMRFRNEPATLLMSRTKNGLDRYDYTNWYDHVFDPLEPQYRIGSLDGIPYVVLQSLYSVSMGEMSTSALTKYLNAYTIGERTYGGHGTLTSYGSSDIVTFDANGYAGQINIGDSIVDGYQIYTTNTMSKMWNWETQSFEVLEGKGLKPMKEILIKAEDIRSGNDQCLIEAVRYINEGKR